MSHNIAHSIWLRPIRFNNLDKANQLQYVWLHFQLKGFMKMSNFAKRTAVIAIFALCLSCAALADNIVFDLSPTNGTTFRPQGTVTGPGQGVSVTQTQTITGIGFFVGGGAQNLNFFIYDGTNTVLLDQNQFAWGGGSADWVYTNTNFTLNAGQTYYFGVVGDSQFNVGYIFPGFAYGNNGLDALVCCNTNYSGFDNPTPTGGGGAEIGLRLLEGGNETPEPASLALLGSGLVGLGGAIRRKFIA